MSNQMSEEQIYEEAKLRVKAKSAKLTYYYINLYGGNQKCLR
jgi:hypothetical protein